MATTSGRPIAVESDSAHVAFVQDSDLGLAGESKWLSASVARDLIKRGIAQESEPGPTTGWSADALKQAGLI
jgi:hypothetical protein